MQKEEMIKAIYEKVADKTLSFGCIVYWAYDYENELEILHLFRKCFYSYKWIYWDEIIPIDKDIYVLIYKWDETILNPIDYEYFNKDLENEAEWSIQWIIWHPVMIGDVLDYIDSIEFNHPNDFIKWYKEKYPIIIDTLFTDWKEKRKSIEEQSDDCITYIYNLIK